MRLCSFVNTYQFSFHQNVTAALRHFSYLHILLIPTLFLKNTFITILLFSRKETCAPEVRVRRAEKIHKRMKKCFYLIMQKPCVLESLRNRSPLSLQSLSTKDTCFLLLNFPFFFYYFSMQFILPCAPSKKKK